MTVHVIIFLCLVLVPVTVAIPIPAHAVNRPAYADFLSAHATFFARAYVIVAALWSGYWTVFFLDWLYGSLAIIVFGVAIVVYAIWLRNSVDHDDNEKRRFDEFVKREWENINSMKRETQEKAEGQK